MSESFLDAVDMAGHWFFATVVVCVGIPLLLLLYLVADPEARQRDRQSTRTMLDGEMKP